MSKTGVLLMDSLQKKLGKRIQEIRKAKKLTQEKLAEIIELDVPNISNIERGKRFVSASTLEKIINALGVYPKDLFDFEHTKTRNELLISINNILNKSNDREIEFYYRMMTIY